MRSAAILKDKIEEMKKEHKEALLDSLEEQISEKESESEILNALNEELKKDKIF